MNNSNLKLVYSDQNKTPMTTSLLVAEKFGKKHEDILKTYRKVLSDYGLTEVSEFFSETWLYDSQNKKRAVIEMTEEGYSLVADRLKGKTALKWKLEYVKAFSAMKRKLLELGQEAPKLLEAKKAELKLVQDENERLRIENLKKQTEYIRTNETGGVRRASSLLLHKVNQGYLCREKVPTYRYVYSITSKGRLAGFTKNKNGTIIFPKK